MKRFFQILTILLAFLLPVIVGGSVGSMLSMRVAMAPTPPETSAKVEPSPSPAYDSQRPTVVVVLGDTVSEITDVLGPYALFAETGLYNVYTAASTRDVRALSGGIDIVPDFAFSDLDRLIPAGPEIIVVPAMTEVALNQSVLAWLRSHAASQNGAGSLLFSWCTGAEVLAASGVLDGKAATAFWADLDSLAETYPQVDWQRGVRYVDEETVLTTAGLTSGIDATLHLLSKRHGEDVVKLVADAIQYQVQFLDDPTMTQHEIAISDSVYVLNAAFYWPKQRLGVWLYDGINELDLAAILDVYTASWTHEAISFAARDAIRSKHGLQLIPRWNDEAPPTFDTLLFSSNAPIADRAYLEQQGMTTTVLPASNEFIVKDMLEHYGQTVNSPSARFAAKRLEYRQPITVGAGFVPFRTLLWVVVLGALGVWARWWIVRRIRAGRTRRVFMAE